MNYVKQLEKERKKKMVAKPRLEMQTAEEEAILEKKKTKEAQIVWQTPDANDWLSSQISLQVEKS